MKCCGRPPPGKQERVFFHILSTGTCTKGGPASSFSVKSVDINCTVGRLEQNILSFADVGRLCVNALSLTVLLCFNNNFYILNKSPVTENAVI